MLGMRARLEGHLADPPNANTFSILFENLFGLLPRQFCFFLDFLKGSVRVLKLQIFRANRLRGGAPKAST